MRLSSGKAGRFTNNWIDRRGEKAVVLEQFIVQGETHLNGEVTISGAKNAAVAIIPATILAQGKCVIENIPNISDIKVLFQILRALGASVQMLICAPLTICSVRFWRAVIVQAYPCRAAAILVSGRSISI